MTRGFTWTVITLRFAVVAVLVAAAVAAWLYLPGTESLPDAGVRALLPADTPAARAEAESARIFGSSLLPRIAVVQRSAGGQLSLDDQKKIARVALRLDQGRLDAFPKGSKALPYINTGRLTPGSRERSTTAITYLGFPDDVAPVDQRNYAEQYARAVSLPNAPARATGFIPGTIAQSDAIEENLVWVELATVLFVALVIGGYLRSLLAPLVTLAAAAIAYVISIGAVAWLAETQGLQLQNQVEPIVVVLLLGVVTDYSVFFLSGMRSRIREGEEPADAARGATQEMLPIIVTAALLVAAGLATLRLSSINFVQTLGPSMAVVVLVSVIVSVTFVPACMRIFSRTLFWPGLGGTPRRDALITRAGARVRTGVARATSRRLVAWPTVWVVGGALVLAATGITYMHLALTPIRGLEGKTDVGTAASDAAHGFTAGIVAPTAVVLRGDGVGGQRDELRRFARELAQRPEVGAVIGAETPVQIPEQFRAVFVRPDAARYFVAFVHHPYSSEAIADLRHLEDAMPAMLERASVDAKPTYAGDTALAKVTVERVHRDLLWVGLAAAAVNFLLLALFLRSLVAPLLLVVSSALAIAATFGLTAYVFRDVVGSGDLTYFVPLAVGVLLLSFGTDYNLFVVGHIWQHAREMPLTEAIRTAVPRASRAISIAGVALACSFAMLAIVPIAPFREFAVAVGIGVIVDTFVVRTLLIPALLAAFGDRVWWPRRPSFEADERAI